MSEEEIRNQLQLTNERIYEQLTYAETKNAVLAGLLGAVIFGITSVIIDLNEDLLWLKIILGISIGSMLIALCVSLSSFFPIQQTQNLKRDKNLFFYGDIAKFKSGDDYILEAKRAKDIELQLAEQNILVSTIVCKKYRKFIVALQFTFSSIFLPYYLYLLYNTLSKLFRKKRNRK